MFGFKINIDEGKLKRLKEAPDRMKAALFPAMEKCMAIAERTAKGEYLSGKALRRRTGRLRGSINTRVTESGNKVKGEIGTNVVYARIHELGGIIKPKKANVLRFNIPGVGWRSAKQVVMPKRPFMRPSMVDNLAGFKDIFKSAIIKAFG